MARKKKRVEEQDEWKGRREIRRKMTREYRRAPGGNY